MSTSERSGSPARRVWLILAVCAASVSPASMGAASATPLASPRCDFDGDGSEDLAIGVPGEDVGGAVDAGAVNVLYGRAVSGLGGDRDQLWTQSGDVKGSPGNGDAFGSSLACGDFDHDGVDDLAIGVPREDVGSIVDAGAVNVLYGRVRSGLTPTDGDLWTQSRALNSTAEPGDLFGASVAAGDFDDDLFDDLAVGAPGEDVTTNDGLERNAGAVNVLYGGDGGLGTAGSQFWSQEAGFVNGAAESGDAFGSSLATGDFDEDGFVDLAVGVPREDVVEDDDGAVNVLYGKDQSGLDAAGDELWSQSGAVAGGPEEDDAFGFALAAGDFNGDNEDDLAIGVPGEDVAAGDDQAANAGAVNVLYGNTSSGLEADDNRVFTQRGPGGPTAEQGDAFGSALAAGDFNGDQDVDLVVGVPGEDVGSTVNAGLVNALYGTNAGLSSDGGQAWSQAGDSIKGVPEEGDTFGSSVATGDFDADGFDDVGIGVPGEGLANVSVGAVNAFYGTGSSGLAIGANQLWTQKGEAVQGAPEAYDRLGGGPTSSGVYRLPYVDGTDVRVTRDHVSHSPMDRIDMRGSPAGEQYAIVAAASGIIRIIVDTNEEPTNDNNYVWIEHPNGEWTKYSHFETDSVTDLGHEEGDPVRVGVALGFEGDVGHATGVHLHWEVAVPDDPANPVTSGGFIIGQNRIPLMCGIPGNLFVHGRTYDASDC